MKSFNERCYSVLRKVPRGKVTTYKEIANALNSKAYRAVGNAMNKNPYAFVGSGEAGGSKSKSLFVPCHRVVKSNGEIGGFVSGIKNKIKMLRKEGIEINKGRINMKKYFHKLK